MFKRLVMLSLCFKAALFGALSEEEGKKKLELLHTSLKLVHGSLQEEYPEQLMAAMFISPDAKVLELGGNVGRNSCVIASLLDNQKNLIVVEPVPDSARQLLENRDANNLSFRVENAAVSRTPLVLIWGWNSQPSEVDIPGCMRLKTTTFQDVEDKYNITFDTLVADCEGALYYMLKDDEKILDKMKTIIVENDYAEFDHYLYTKKEFEKRGFSLVYSRPLVGGQGHCAHCFFEVWTR